MLRCNLQDEHKPRDLLGLGRRVDERLRTVSGLRRGAKLVFVDVAEFSGACELGGRYTVKDGKVRVSLTLFHGEKELGRFTVEGEKADLDALAKKIVDETEGRLPSTDQ